MPALNDILLVPDVRPKVIQDCVKLIDDEVASKGGLTGLAIKAAYAIVKAVKPGFIVESVDHMLDDFTAKLDPIYQKAVSAGQTASQYMPANRSEVAEALLSISDARAVKAKNQTVKKAYEKLRPTGKRHVEEAVPGVAKLIDKHAASAPKSA
jgi:hypothetical protein